MDGHAITMLGTGLIADFYTNTLHGQRGRDRVRVVWLGRGVSGGGLAVGAEVGIGGMVGPHAAMSTASAIALAADPAVGRPDRDTVAAAPDRCGPGRRRGRREA